MIITDIRALSLVFMKWEPCHVIK